MKKVIILTIVVLSCFLILLNWQQKFPEEKLAKRLSESKIFIAYDKLINENIHLIISDSHHKRDSIRKERTKHIFDYSFQKRTVCR